MPKRLTHNEWQQVRTAHASGLGLRELARNMGIPAGTILARSKREGWTRQIERAKTLGSQSSSPPTPVATAAAVSMAERGKRHVERVAGIVEKTLPHLEGMAPGAILDRIEDVERLDKLARRTYGITDGEGGQNCIINIALIGMNVESVFPACVGTTGR